MQQTQTRLETTLRDGVCVTRTRPSYDSSPKSPLYVVIDSIFTDLSRSKFDPLGAYGGIPRFFNTANISWNGPIDEESVLSNLDTYANFINKSFEDLMSRFDKDAIDVVEVSSKATLPIMLYVKKFKRFKVKNFIGNGIVYELRGRRWVEDYIENKQPYVDSLIESYRQSGYIPAKELDKIFTFLNYPDLMTNLFTSWIYYCGWGLNDFDGLSHTNVPVNVFEGNMENVKRDGIKRIHLENESRLKPEKMILNYGNGDLLTDGFDSIKPLVARMEEGSPETKIIHRGIDANHPALLGKLAPTIRQESLLLLYPEMRELKREIFI